MLAACSTTPSCRPPAMAARHARYGQAKAFACRTRRYRKVTCGTAAVLPACPSTCASATCGGRCGGCGQACSCVRSIMSIYTGTSPACRVSIPTGSCMGARRMRSLVRPLRRRTAPAQQLHGRCGLHPWKSAGWRQAAGGPRRAASGRLTISDRLWARVRCWVLQRVGHYVAAGGASTRASASTCMHAHMHARRGHKSACLPSKLRREALCPNVANSPTACAHALNSLVVVHAKACLCQGWDVGR